MKNKRIRILLGVLVLATAAACGKAEEGSASGNGGAQSVVELNPADGAVAISKAGEGGGEQAAEQPAEEEPAEEVEVVPEGMYRSELTNEIIDEKLKNQRPIAAMVDNEVTALPHFGLTQADIVYEMMNSTKNGRITRLMPIVKDWENLVQFGSIRSARPTNFMIAAEYNAILCHDGGPFYINDYTAKKYTNNLSGGFARFDNGKSMEYTEYITYDDYTNAKGKSFSGLAKRIESAGYSTEYNSYYPGPHFLFSDKSYNLSDVYKDAESKKDISLPFPHNKSELHYNESTGTYDYSEYGEPHLDAQNGNKQLTFKNVIIQKCNYTKLDDGGYLIYNCIVSTPWDGYFLTNGECIPIKWVKQGESSQTVFTDLNGAMINLNTGKTYIAIVPDDVWSDLEMN